MIVWLSSLESNRWWAGYFHQDSWEVCDFSLAGTNLGWSGGDLPCLAPVGFCKQAVTSPWLVPPDLSLACCACVSCPVEQLRVSRSDLNRFWGLPGHLMLLRQMSKSESQPTDDKERVREEGLNKLIFFRVMFFFYFWSTYFLEIYTGIYRWNVWNLP